MDCDILLSFIQGFAGWQLLKITCKNIVLTWSHVAVLNLNVATDSKCIFCGIVVTGAVIF